MVLDTLLHVSRVSFHLWRW